MEPRGAERRLTAILSADAVGYTRLMAEDEAATVRTVTDCRDEISLLVRQHRGRVVDSPGDSLLAEFPSATGAVSCAVEAQRVLTVRNSGRSPDRRMEYRMGVHLGEVRVEGERIYGDGINIAARLERLAEPGAICVSHAVYEQVRNKLALQYEDLGDQSLRNVPEPVRVYRVLPRQEPEGLAESLPGMSELTVPGFRGRPAIAVLAFENLSGDPEQEYLGDGIAEDLLTRLSAWAYFPVIARNSSFVYKGRPVDVRQVSRDLGVRYVVEGSVRRTGERVRIGAQLIDAASGHHIWAERYDRDLRDVFALQDDITEAIVASMYPELKRFDQGRARSKDPQNLDAWDCTQRGHWHSNRFTQEDNAHARLLYERAVELDPHCAAAFWGLAFVYYERVLFQWSESSEDSISKMLQAARKSVALDERDPYGHLAVGLAYSLTGQQGRMIEALKLATRLNPSLSSAYSYLGAYLALSGRAEDAIAALDKAMRLSPQDPNVWRHILGVAIAHSVAERYDAAIEWAERCLHRAPDSHWVAYAILAASYGHLGRLEEAHSAAQELLRVQPQFSLTVFRLVLSAAQPEFLERAVAGLRRAGIQE